MNDIASSINYNFTSYTRLKEFKYVCIYTNAHTNTYIQINMYIILYLQLSLYKFVYISIVYYIILFLIILHIIYVAYEIRRLEL